MDLLHSGKCPVCQADLQIRRLGCPNCRAEYPMEEPLSPFECLSQPQAQFLETFLRARGSIKETCQRLQMSYPTAKRRLEELLVALGYQEKEDWEDVEAFDMSFWQKKKPDCKTAGEAIQTMLYENRGDITIPLLDGKTCRIVASNDGRTFSSDKLNRYQMQLEFRVFDVMVELLREQGGTARKGNGHGREDKVGFGKCTPDTVVGAVALRYFQKQPGESTFDPVFVLAAILDWAGIAHNQRGIITLAPAYLAPPKEK